MRTRATRLTIAVALMVLFAGCIVVERRTAPRGQAPGVTGEDLPKADPLPLEPSSDRRLVGSLGWALLSPEVARAVIEVDQLGGAEAAPQAIDALKQALIDEGGKAAVDVVMSTVPEVTPPEGGYTLEDLVTVAEDHRDRSSGDGTVVLHVLVLPGRFEARGVGGAAFHATTFALFPDELSRMLPPGANVADFQAAVAVHELGHTFGLVNRTGQGAFHEDPDHPGHTGDDNSVMYWAIESPSLVDIFGSGPPQAFNAADRKEMDAIRQQRPNSKNGET